MDGLFQSGVQFSNGVVNVGPYGCWCGGFVIGLRRLGLWLRQVDGAFNFIRSHIACLLAGGLVRARSVLEAPGAARLGLGFGLLLFGFARLVWHSRPRLCFCFS